MTPFRKRQEKVNSSFHSNSICAEQTEMCTWNTVIMAAGNVSKLVGVNSSKMNLHDKKKTEGETFISLNNENKLIF